MMPENTERLIEQLRPWLKDEDAFGRLHADFHDMFEICTWFLRVMDTAKRKPLSRDEIESFLIEIDVGLVQHASFHLKSMKKEIGAALRKLAEADAKEEKLHGAA